VALEAVGSQQAPGLGDLGLSPGPQRHAQNDQCGRSRLRFAHDVSPPEDDVPSLTRLHSVKKFTSITVQTGNGL
jgi:hypothetical protein